MEVKEYTNADGSVLTALSFPALDAAGMVRHVFSTRCGGVSSGIFESMNLGFSRGDDPASVRENYHRIAAVLGTTEDRMVATYQTHTANVMRVSEEDAGKGITRERDYRDVDGLITDVPGLVLTVFGADCVPVLFADPVHRAIGACHSGWRGTEAGIGKVTVEKMQEAFGTKPEDLIAAIGPSICGSCYEVGPELNGIFSAAFPGHEKEILTDKGNGKYQLDLWKANRIVLMDAGIPEKQISITDICTCCNPELLFSHRKSQGRRGNNAAFLMLLP